MKKEYLEPKLEWERGPKRSSTSSTSTSPDGSGGRAEEDVEGGGKRYKVESELDHCSPARASHIHESCWTGSRCGARKS